MVVDSFGGEVGGEAQDFAARDSSEARGAMDEEEAQGLHAGDAVAIGSLARARFRPSQGRMQLKAAHQVMRQHAELEPGAVGAVVIGGYHVESKFTLEFGKGLFLGATAGSEVPQGAWGEGKIGRHRGIFEVTVVGGEEVELVVLGARMMHALAVDHHSQLQSPDRQGQLGLEAINIRGDGGPARLGGDQGFDPGPLNEGDLDRIAAVLPGEQLEQLLLEKAASMRSSSGTERPKRTRSSANNCDKKTSAPFESWTLPGRFLSLRICPV